MKWLNCTRMKLVLIGCVAAIVLGGGSAKADFTFGEPVNLGPPINTCAHECFSTISPDGLELYFFDLFFLRPGGVGGSDIWVIRRSSVSEPWSEPVNLGPTINSEYDDGKPSISADGLTLYFSSKRPGGYGDMDVWVSQRPSIDDPWGAPVNLGPVINSPAGEYYPCLSPGGLVLFFSGYDSPSGPWQIGGLGHSDMWMTRRKSTADTWEPPVNLGPSMNTGHYDCQPRVSPDGSVLYFNSSRPGKIGGFSDIWQAPIIPIVNFNGDAVVDAGDLCIMIDHWGEIYSLCDIGPTPFGDGIVDVQDLIALAGHLFEDYRLIAHWKLDEVEGSIAYDSAGQYDGNLCGGPIWQPSGGRVAGALQLDGVEDYVGTPFVLNPADGSLSVFAWVKAGVAGRAIIAQAKGTVGSNSTWLCTDPTDGRLITRLMHPPFPPLESQSVITDGQWHHVGLVYDRDSLHRCLYVDGAETARDVGPVAPMPCDGGLYIGAGETFGATNFWAGLIDDVRIYNRAVSP